MRNKRLAQDFVGTDVEDVEELIRYHEIALHQCGETPRKPTSNVSAFVKMARRASLLFQEDPCEAAIDDMQRAASRCRLGSGEK